MKKMIIAMTVAASFSALADETDTEDAKVRVAATMAHRAQACPARLDGDAGSGEHTNIEMGSIARATSMLALDAILDNNLTACFDNRLRHTRISDGRYVIAAIDLGTGRVSLNPKTGNTDVLEFAGKGVAEVMKQIQQRGGARPPAHMLLPLAVVEDKQSAGGFTVVPNEESVIRVACASASATVQVKPAQGCVP